MTREELIAELEALPEGSHVFLYADHGQNHEGVSSVEFMSRDEANYRGIHVDKPVAVLYGW